MRVFSAVFVFATLCAGPIGAAEVLKLPPEVTPKLRAACESDVRRLCVSKNSTIAKVKRCVAKKFFKLGRRCQMELAAVGITGL